MTSNLRNHECLSRSVLLVSSLLLLLFFSPVRTITPDGQAITSFIPSGTGPILRSFLEPCESLTLETKCTEEEYESNEDCLPQKTDNCDHSKELFCLSGVCLPNCHPHKESYDHAIGRCFRKVGSDCRLPNASAKTTQTSIGVTTANVNNVSDESPVFGRPTTTDLGETTRFATQPEEDRARVTVTSECERNAVCERGQCRCVRNFTYDPTFNKCVLYATFGTMCNDTVDCDRKSDIVCKENQCHCKSQETQYFHLKRKRCYILIGQVCSTGLQFCPDNSHCVRANTWRTDMTPKKPSQDELNKAWNLNSSQTRLFALYQHRLIGNDDDGGTEEEHFIGILGDDEDGEFICKCGKGYGSTRDHRFCFALHGTRCNTLHRCNGERGLKCVNGSCACEREDQVYSDMFQQCITMIGGSCTADGKGEREEDVCPIGAFCHKEEGRCNCDEGLVPSATPPTTGNSAALNSCMKGFGMSCKNNNASSSPEIDSLEPPCNPEIGLECSTREERCLCKDGSNQYYDMANGKCKDFSGSVDTAKIPVIQIAPKSIPEDREYAFHKNVASRFCRDFVQELLVFVTAFTRLVCNLIV